MKKNVNTVEITGIVEEKMTSVENLSLRKLAMYLEVNYNMLLKAGKQPKAGEVYNPELLNYDAIEAYLRKKMGDAFDGIDWNEAAECTIQTRTKEAITWEVGSKLKIRGDESVYQVMIATATHVCIMAVDGTQPRVFSWNTFEHQTPRLYKEEEEV